MRKMVRVGLINVVCLFLFGSVGIAQPYHRLTTRDFAGTPPADMPYAAYTNCYVSYSYNPVRHNNYYDVDFNVQVFLNAGKSWMRFDQITSREMLQDILTHEQGHYNMAYLMRNELYAVFTHHRYTANYQNEIIALFKQVGLKYHQLNEDYEEQTEHMDNAQGQLKWNAWFARQLDNSAFASSNHNRAEGTYNRPLL